MDFGVSVMQLVIGWTCVGVFICTAVIAILSTIGWVNVDVDFKKQLQKVLIIEIVIICVGVFSGLVKIDPKPVDQQLEAGQKAEDFLTASETRKTAGLPSDQPAPAAAELTPRVYVQIPDNAQRDIAAKAQSILRDAGYLAPGIERVGTKAPAVTELRYFLPAEQSLADTISGQLKAAGIDAPSRFVSGFENANIRQHHFELWFAKPAS
jgi:hypothetical protein